MAPHRKSPAPNPQKTPSPAAKASVRPLKARPGARYACFGDGLCCTDLHGLGPLTPKEVKALRVISSDVVLPPRESEFDEPMLRTRKDGGCLFLGPARCDLHAALGAEAKPEGCRRFPLGLTATPTGGRVTTRHRCPCRTLGERPVLTGDAAEPSLVDGRGHLSADRRIGATVFLKAKKRVDFAEWETLETSILARLDRGEDPQSVLDTRPFPPLRKDTYRRVADEMLEEGVTDTRFGRALGWFAASLLSLTGEKRPRTDPLDWEDPFDRAARRTRVVEPAQRILADWVADEIWALEWAEERGTFKRCRADLATRLAIARDLCSRLARRGQREDLAAAQAVTIVDLLGDAEWWDDVVDAMPA